MFSAGALPSFLAAPTLRPLAHHSDETLRKRAEKIGAYFLGVLRVGSTSLVRGRKEQLIAQEEEKGSLI